MGGFLSLLAAAGGLLPCADAPTPCGSHLWQPAFCVDDVLRGATEPYLPQPGDIFLASDQELWSKVGHWWVGSQGLQHSGIVFDRSDGAIALLQAGPFNSLKIEVLDPIPYMRDTWKRATAFGCDGVASPRPRNSRPR